MIICPFVIHLMSPWNVKLVNHSPARVVVIGRLVYKIASIASLLL